jgi:hypothetical protein
MDFSEQIINVKKPEDRLLENLEKEYRDIGDRFGYVMVQSPLFLCLKKHGSQAGFEIQFGNQREFENSLRRLSESDSDICFLITSSKVKTMKIEDVRSLLLLRFQIKDQIYRFIDIETGKWVEANSEWKRFSSSAMRPDWAKPGPMPPRPLFRKKK